MSDEILVADVLAYYRPNGWYVRNNDWNQVIWTDAEPITKKEFEAGFELVRQKRAKDAADKAAARAAAEAKLAALGLTPDDLEAILG